MNKTFPLVSVLIPIKNEASYIGSSLGAVFSQDYPSDCMEILIADGMSTDETRKIVLDLVALHPNLKIDILDNPGKIAPIGLNIALHRARGEIIIRVDGHCILPPNYVSKCVDHLHQDRVDGVGGSIETIGETLIAKAIALGMSSQFGVGNSAFRTFSAKNLIADTVPFPAYTKQIIKRVGLYDEELVRNQDDEYNYRIREMGGKILLAFDIRSTYFSRASLKSLWWQYFQYGFWKIRVLQKHPRQMSLRQFVPPLFVSVLLGSFLASFFLSLFWIIPLGIFSLYLLVTLLLSAWISSRNGWNYFPLLPVIFMILHCSYGFGFLLGLIKFINRWGDKQGKVLVWS